MIDFHWIAQGKEPSLLRQLADSAGKAEGKRAGGYD